MRPFEIGDLVVVEYADSFKGVASILSINSSSIRVISHIKNDGEYNIRKEHIKTIRKHRKGSKESRDVVAMLGCVWHNKLLFIKKDLTDVYKYNYQEIFKRHLYEYWDNRKNGIYNSHVEYTSYQRAKDMLK